MIEGACREGNQLTKVLGYGESLGFAFCGLSDRSVQWSLHVVDVEITKNGNLASGGSTVQSLWPLGASQFPLSSLPGSAE